MNRTNSQFDVLGLGAVAVDDFIFVESYPKADAKARVIRRERQCGGLTAIALIAAARLGARCAYAGVLGPDELSRFVLTCLAREKVDVSKVKLAASARPVHSNIVVDRGCGTRAIFFDEQGVVGANPRMPTALVSSCKVLLIDHLGMDGMIRAARLAGRAGIPVVADLENNHHPRSAELLALSGHLIVSRGFASALTGVGSPAEAVRALVGQREVAVVTCGEQGCWSMARGWTAPKHQPAFRVQAVDTTGCGDVFHGAYAFALARGWPLDERIRLASAAAALKASRGGGPSGIPSLASARRLMKQGKDPA